VRFQPIYDIAEVCARKGLKNVVLCPGSRCAPLTLAFSRHHAIKVRTFSDERSAAFVALGISQQLNTPAALVCTSGTAVYNFASAVAEAFFNQIPLVVITADRPVEWVNQHDGQTIYQQGVFGAHVKQSFQLPQNYDHRDEQWMINRIVNDAINLARQEPKGPVHINAPFREPLYPQKDETITFSKDVRIIDDTGSDNRLSSTLPENILQEFLSNSNILVLSGQSDYNEDLLKSLHDFTSQFSIPVVGEITSNLHPLRDLVKHADLFIGEVSDKTKEMLQPDLLITFGKSVLSKNLKLFVRNYSPKIHWHIQEAGMVADTFQHLTRIVRLTPSVFFAALKKELPQTMGAAQHNYFQAWKIEEEKSSSFVKKHFHSNEYAGEFGVVQKILDCLPEKSSLHLANSMSVRYANFIGLEGRQKNIRVYCNRGTSGIDGCSSTAAGHSLVSDTPHLLITGDLAFFYDRNAFWHNYSLPNLRIVVLNNHGGVIFKMIDGPKELPEADEYFVTRQKLTAKKLCEEFDFVHLKYGDSLIEDQVKEFFTFDGPTKILEIETSVAESKKIYDNFKATLKTNYEL
jgi:2-succinyl-5-enolpyruvyl-6-hydroxy-3-cyclohexene-1-carboxylate synthase